MINGWSHLQCLSLTQLLQHIRFYSVQTISAHKLSCNDTCTLRICRCRCARWAGCCLCRANERARPASEQRVVVVTLTLTVESASCLCVLDQVLGVDLLLLKHHKYGGVGHVVDAAVEEVHVRPVLRGRTSVLGGTFAVVSNQNSRHKHEAYIEVAGVVVGVTGITGKVTSLAVHCAIDSTHSPVKIGLTDSIHMSRLGPMEKLQLQHRLPSISHLQVSFA